MKELVLVLVLVEEDDDLVQVDFAFVVADQQTVKFPEVALYSILSCSCKAAMT